MQELSALEKEIKQLEQKKNNLLYEQSKLAWRKWHEEAVEFFETIKNRCFVTKSNDSFQMFKVIGWHKGNYLGNSDFKGFYEIHTEGYFTIHSADYTNKFTIPFTPDTPFGCFALRKLNKKKEIQSTSQLTYYKQSLNECCVVDTSKVTKIQYRGDEYEDDEWPFQDLPERSAKGWVKDYWNWYEVSQDFYNNAIKIVNYIAIETDKLWEKYHKELETATVIK